MSFSRAIVEAIESRQHLSASTSGSAVNLIGATSGVTASANSPSITAMYTTANGVESTANSAADRDTAIRLTIQLATGHGGIDETSLNRTAVTLTNNTTGASVAIDRVKTSGGGDVIIIQPTNPLAANTTYRVNVNASSVGSNLKIKDVNGTAFLAYAATFTTGTKLALGSPTIAFSQQVVAGDDAPNASAPAFLAVTIGPDHRLYASTSDGYIYRYNIATDGTLSGETIITTVRDNNGGGRIITGITFDPSATAGNLVLWVSHGQYRFGNSPGSGGVQEYAQNFTGKISKISGPNLGSYQDVIINIPRSVKDHINNQIVFSPNGKSFFFAIPSMSAMGKPDGAWGNVSENIYSAAILSATVGGTNGINAYLSANGPVNLLIDSNGTTHYNIYDAAAPLKLYADGIRNDFDLVFHSNGHLYAPVNGSSAGGNTPATPADLSTVPSSKRLDFATDGNYTGPVAPSLTAVPQIEQDTLLDVKQNAYYGHPNPARGEYILDGGNPTAGQGNDPYDIGAYPAGTQPDRNYTLPVLDMGKDYSPDGVIEYHSVGGKASDLNNYLLIARYSSGSDILAVKPSANGTINTADSKAVIQRITGFYGLHSPLDVVEDMTNGNVYVTELVNEVSQGAIVLLKPQTVAATASASTDVTKVSLYVTPGDKAGFTKTVTLTNSGSGNLILDVSATKITGLDRKNFIVTDLGTTDITIASGASRTFHVKGVLASGDNGPRYGNLAFATNDPSKRYTVVQLRAFKYVAPARMAQSASKEAFASIGSGVKDDVLGTFSDVLIDGAV